jgi:hypothetical protein
MFVLRLESTRSYRLRHLGLAAAVIAPLWLGSPNVSAAPVPPNAERLFADGLELAHAGDCTQARDKFAASYAVDPAPGTLVNWALCEEKLGRSATALELLRVADKTLPPGSSKRGAVSKHLESLTKRAPLLRLRLLPSAPAGTTVHLDDVALEPSVLSHGLLRDPGLHVILVRSSGRQDRRYEAVLVEGRTLEMTIEAGAPATAATPMASGATPVALRTNEEVRTESSSTAPAAGARSDNVLGWVLAGAGVAALGTGAVTGLLAQNKWSKVERDCDVDRRTCQSDAGIEANHAGQTLATMSTIAFVAGGVSLAAGGYLLLTKKSAPVSAQLAPSVGPGLAGLHLGGQF